jgi:hypothetical protein
MSSIDGASNSAARRRSLRPYDDLVPRRGGVSDGPGPVALALGVMPVMLPFDVVPRR